MLNTHHDVLKLVAMDICILLEMLQHSLAQYQSASLSVLQFENKVSVFNFLIITC